MRMIPFTDPSSSHTVYINPQQVIYCIVSDRRTSEGRVTTSISFLKGRDITVLGTVDEVASKLAGD